MKRRARELSLQQCYEALDLEQNADLDALKHAYRRRAFELHPDLHPENPQAGNKFQVVNEAYVILSRILGPDQKRDTTEASSTSTATNTEAKHEEQPQESASDAQNVPPEFGTDTQESSEETQRHGEDQRTRRAAQAAYAKEEDVLRDLLNDPFARRVFEDIYTQMKDTRDASPSPEADTMEKNAALGTPAAEWGKEQLNLDFSRGIGTAVKSWMRKQIDEVQTFYLPPAMLRPGSRIRLQIRRGISDEVATVEIKLPQNYVTGKPVRLKGMGKRIGRWQGDLYLTLIAK